MKILVEKKPGERVLGEITCKVCESKLELQVQDLHCGRARDFDGTSESYCMFDCPVCHKSQDAPAEWQKHAWAYEETKKK